MAIKKIELNEKEAETLIRLLEIALKSEGFNVAESVIYLKRKIEEPFIKK